ncbi:unnamed protein product, partial [Meganyctiphanes norvegica]
MHVEEIDVEVLYGPKNENQQGNNSKSQQAETTKNVNINKTSTSSDISNIIKGKVVNNLGDNSDLKKQHDSEIGSNKVNMKEKTKSQEGDLKNVNLQSDCKDKPTIVFSTLKELHQMNAAKMFDNKLSASKEDLIESKEIKTSETSPLFKSKTANVFTKDSKILNSSYDNSKRNSCTNAHSNSSFANKINPNENKLSTNSSQYPLLVSSESRFIRSWGGTPEGYKHEENETKTKPEDIKKNSIETKEQLDPIRYFNALLSDVSFEDSFFQCPTSENLQNTFQEHLNSSLFFGETAESTSPSENRESTDIESETGLSPSVLKMLDEVMNEALESDSHKNSKDPSEFDSQYHLSTKNNLFIKNNDICKKDGRDLDSVREDSNEFLSQSCNMLSKSEFSLSKQGESSNKLSSLAKLNECKHTNNIGDNQIHDSSLSGKQCSFEQGRNELSPILDSRSPITISNDKEIDLEEKQNKSDNENKSNVNEFKEITNDSSTPSIKLKLIKSQVNPTDKKSRHTWSSDPSYTSKLDPRDNYSEIELDVNEGNKSLDSEFNVSYKDFLPAGLKNVDTAASTTLLINKDEKESEVGLQYKHTSLDIPKKSEKCVLYSPETQKLENELVSDSHPNTLLNITASSESLPLNLSDDELDEDCPIIAINSDDEVEVLDDGIKGVNLNKIDENIEGKDQSHLYPNSTEIYRPQCDTPETQDLYTLLSSGLDETETMDKEKVKNEAMDNNSTSNDFIRDTEINLNSSSRQAHDVCCGILDNSISHNNLCRSPRLKEFVDFSSCVREDSNRQVYSPKLFRKKLIEDIASENEAIFVLPKPLSPKEISLLKLQKEDKSHSLYITNNKVLFGCTNSGPQCDDDNNSQKSDDSGPGFLEMSFPEQMSMWQNNIYVDEKEQDKMKKKNEIIHFENKPLGDTTDIELSAYESEIDTIQATPGLDSESCVYDASDEDNMESDYQSNYDSIRIPKVKTECLSRDGKSLMLKIKNESNDVLNSIPFLLSNKNEQLSEAIPSNMVSEPSSSCQRDLSFNLSKENVNSKHTESITYNPKNIASCETLPVASGEHETDKKMTKLVKHEQKNNSFISSMSKDSLHTSYLRQKYNLKNKPTNNWINSLTDKKENTNTRHNDSRVDFEYLGDPYIQNKNKITNKSICSQLRRKSENTFSTDFESDESYDSIDCKQPRDRQLFTLIPPALKRSYDGHVTNSTVRSKPGGSHDYDNSPNKKGLNKLWEKWASKNASEECNAQSEETDDQKFDASYRNLSPYQLLGSHSRKRKRPLNEKDNTFISDKTFNKIIFSYKKGGFVCRPTSDMLRKMSELRRKEEESKAQLEKQKQDERGARLLISKEREDILRMTKDDLHERRKRMKALRMQTFSCKDNKKRVEELALQYRAR